MKEVSGREDDVQEMVQMFLYLLEAAAEMLVLHR